MSTPTETLRHPRSRLHLVGFVFLLFALIVSVRFFVLPYFYPHLAGGAGDLSARVLESAGVALLAGLTIPALSLWLGPDTRAKELISILDRKMETSPAFQRAMVGTGKWYFRGGLGSYFRSTTLPSLIKQKPPISVMVVMLNIRNIELLQRYAGYRTIQSGQSISAKDIRHGVLETVWGLALAVKAAEGAFDKATISFADTYSSFRVDLSDREVFLTQDNPDAPAIRFAAESSYYKGFQNEFAQAAKLHCVDLVVFLKHVNLNAPARFFKEAFSIDLEENESKLLVRLRA